MMAIAAAIILIEVSKVLKSIPRPSKILTITPIPIRRLTILRMPK